MKVSSVKFNNLYGDGKPHVAKNYSGDPRNVSVTFETPISVGMIPGNYFCEGFVFDTLGHLASVRTKTFLLVKRTGVNFDDVGPVVTDISASVPVVDSGSVASTVDVTVSLTDDTAVSSISMICRSEESSKRGH